MESSSGPEKRPAEELYMGLDLSTQQLKAIVVDCSLKVVHESSVAFDSELGEFGTKDGVVRGHDGLVVTVPTVMWVKAFDVLFDKLKTLGVRFQHITGIGGCGQQHGSVYWKTGAGEVLHNLDPNDTLASQLKDQFSVAQSPIWMDSSTTGQCREMEACIGGAQKMADLTGSKAYERFTGNQILKIYQTQPQLYKDTERISLISSFCASLLIGKYASIDYSDGSGMNLWNIRTKKWESNLIQTAGGSELESKLGLEPVATRTEVGPISPYLAKRYGFSPSCTVAAFMGDNPASLAGMRLQPGDVVVSLGTSDTVFVWLDDPQPQLMGHVFVNPVNEAAYMALLCYKNGSLSRQKVCEECAEGSWEIFNSLLDSDSSPPGNNGIVGFFFHIQEITPPCQGVHYFDGVTEVNDVSKEAKVRAVIEGQFLAKFNHTQKLGYNIGPTSRILATGGASTNQHILQILADVFNAPVYISMETANSTCLGGAYIARNVVMGTDVPFEKVVMTTEEYRKVASPRQSANEVYKKMAASYAELEDRVIKEYAKKHVLK